MTVRIVTLTALLMMGVAGLGSAQDFVVVCPINGMIEDGVGVLVERAVRESAGAKALILEVDTPGGLVDSAIDITRHLLHAPCPTIAYVQGMGAISAGALISYACDSIIMAPDTNIGAATPVIASPEGMMPTGEKEVSFMRARMRSMAEAKGHNPAIAEAMVDKDVELRARRDEQGKLQIYAVYPGGKEEAAPDPAQAPTPMPSDDPLETLKRLFPAMVTGRVQVAPPEATGAGEAEAPSVAPTAPGVPPLPEGVDVILPAGKLLTLTPKEALEYGVIPGTANGLPDVLRLCGLENVEIRRITPTWAERLFRWLTSPTVAGLLLLLGIGGIYLEFKTPGFGLPGIVGITCLALFFGAHLIIGLADWVDVLLVVVGLGLILVELFLIPGFGLVGAAGILCLLAGLYLALTSVPIPQYSWEFDRLENALTSLSIAVFLFTGFVFVTWKLFPYTPLYGRMVLTHAQEQAKGYVVQSSDVSAQVIGTTGVAVTMLRPAGRGRFDDVTYQVVTRGDFLPAGTPIRIVVADGNRYVVERIEEQA